MSVMADATCPSATQLTPVQSTWPIMPPRTPTPAAPNGGAASLSVLERRRARRARQKFVVQGTSRLPWAIALRTTLRGGSHATHAQAQVHDAVWGAHAPLLSLPATHSCGPDNHTAVDAQGYRIPPAAARTELPPWWDHAHEAVIISSGLWRVLGRWLRDMLAEYEATGRLWPLHPHIQAHLNARVFEGVVDGSDLKSIAARLRGVVSYLYYARMAERAGVSMTTMTALDPLLQMRVARKERYTQEKRSRANTQFLQQDAGGGSVDGAGRGTPPPAATQGTGSGSEGGGGGGHWSGGGDGDAWTQWYAGDVTAASGLTPSTASCASSTSPRARSRVRPSKPRMHATAPRLDVAHGYTDAAATLSTPCIADLLDGRLGAPPTDAAWHAVHVTPPSAAADTRAPPPRPPAAQPARGKARTIDSYFPRNPTRAASDTPAHDAEAAVVTYITPRCVLVADVERTERCTSDTPSPRHAQDAGAAVLTPTRRGNVTDVVHHGQSPCKRARLVCVGV